MIEISQAAAREISRIKSARNQPNSQLRLKVESGGCSGLFYALELQLATNHEDSSDRHFESNQISIVVDSVSYQYLNGIKIDYAEDLMGGGFRFQNPNANKVCGCGISFASESVNQD